MLATTNCCWIQKKTLFLKKNTFFDSQILKISRTISCVHIIFVIESLEITACLTWATVDRQDEHEHGRKVEKRYTHAHLEHHLYTISCCTVFYFVEMISGLSVYQSCVNRDGHTTLDGLLHARAALEHPDNSTAGWCFKHPSATTDKAVVGSRWPSRLDRDFIPFLHLVGTRR